LVRLIEKVARELAKYKLYLLGVQEVRWGKGDTEPTDNYTFFYRNGRKLEKIA
jgi:hypothetical protein